LRLAWVAGLAAAFPSCDPVGPTYDPPGGDQGPVAGPAGPYTRVHAVDLVILDAAGAVAFDSTTASSYVTKAFDDRRRVHEWHSEGRVCRLVQHTAWSSPSASRVLGPEVYPDDGRIDERCSAVASTRLTSLSGLGGDVILEAGHNVRFEVADEVVGLRRRSVVQIVAEAGAGAGVAPGCVTPPISSIGGATADSGGNLNLAGGDCYRAAAPFVNAGGGRFEPVLGSLALRNDCKACCTCESDADIQAQLLAAYAALKALAVRAEAARDRRASNVTRWKAVVRPPDVEMTLTAVPHDKRYVELAVRVCNRTDQCLGEPYGQLRLHWESPRLPDPITGLLTDAPTVVGGTLLLPRDAAYRSTVCGSMEARPNDLAPGLGVADAGLLFAPPTFVPGSGVTGWGATLQWPRLQPKGSTWWRLRVALTDDQPQADLSLVVVVTMTLPPAGGSPGSTVQAQTTVAWAPAS